MVQRPSAGPEDGLATKPRGLSFTTARYDGVLTKRPVGAVMVAIAPNRKNTTRRSQPENNPYSD
jgi:hypothetical protein